MLSRCTDPSSPRFTWLEQFRKGQGRKGSAEEGEDEEEEEEEAAAVARELCLAAPSSRLHSLARLRKIILLPLTCHLTHKMYCGGT